MNTNLMMLLPLLMAKNKESAGGLSPEILMNIFSASGGQTANGVNPMMAMLMSMMGNKKSQSAVKRKEASDEEKTKETVLPDPQKILDKDVLNMLKIFIELKKAEKETIS